tara:strand:+ start:11394 stop:12164 length:771 start_codon:yes stop_codon:yes gene_type:complete
MANISIYEWQELTDSNPSADSVKKEALFKFIISLVLIIAYLLFAALQGLLEDLRLASILLPPNILALVIIAFSKEAKIIRWVTYIAIMIFLAEFAFIGISLDDTRGLIYYVSFSVLYNFELERLAWNKWLIIIYAVCSIAPIFLFNLEMFLQVSIALIFFFISGVVYQGNKRRQEIQLLKENQKAYEIFIKHTRLIEHNVINSISKLVYVSEMLKARNPKPDIETQELIEIIDQEIGLIEKVILETDKESLKQFKI